MLAAGAQDGTVSIWTTPPKTSETGYIIDPEATEEEAVVATSVLTEPGAESTIAMPLSYGGLMTPEVDAWRSH